MVRALPLCVLWLFFCCSTGAYSQTASTLKASQLLGEWTFVKFNFQMAGNKKWDQSTFDLKLVISAVDKEIFEGRYIFHSLTHNAHDGIKDTKARDINLLGTISLSGDKIFFVIVGEADSVYYEGRLINEAHDRVAWIRIRRTRLDTSRRIDQKIDDMNRWTSRRPPDDGRPWLGAYSGEVSPVSSEIDTGPAPEIESPHREKAQNPVRSISGFSR